MGSTYVDVALCDLDSMLGMRFQIDTLRSDGLILFRPISLALYVGGSSH